MAWRPDQLLWGVTYLPAEVGPWLWHEFSAERTRRDLRRIRAAGFGVVRVPLAWDAFVPTPRQVSRHRLRDLETLLGIALECDLRVVPVLFAQSFGDCVLLPRYAVARGERRRGVRVVVDGIVEAGAPRDVWDDPLMLEVEALWLEETLRAFANHPGVLAWDLGHDPATTCRPVRIAHVAAWARLMGERVRAAGDVCWMTLGAGDVLQARGMRLAVVAPHVDAIGISVGAEELDPLRVGFLMRVAQRLAVADGDAPVPPLVVHLGIAAEPVADFVVDSGPPAHPTGTGRPGPGGPAGRSATGSSQVGRAGGPQPAPAQQAVRFTGATLERLPDDGAVAILNTLWTDLGPRPVAAPPYDRHPLLAATGVAAANGDLKPHGEVWSTAARRDTAAGNPAPWPPGAFDAAQWYENLPDASNDLFARFRADFHIAGE